MSVVRRFPVAVMVLMAVLIAGASVASAHVEPGPRAAEAGTRVTIGFVVEHGCDGSPTVRVSFLLPDSVTDPAPEAPDAWTATTAGQQVTFEGGPLAADVEGVFGVEMTLPAEPGTIYFPFVQTCEQGELAWIAIPEPGAPEQPNPAPALLVTDGPPTPEELEGPPPVPEPAPEPAPEPSATTAAAATTAAPVSTAVAATTAAPSTTAGATTAAPTTATTGAPATTSAPSTTAGTDEVAAPADAGGDDDGGSAAGWIVGGIVAVVVVGGGALLWTRRRRPA